jgi:hypothetical protein
MEPTPFFRGVAATLLALLALLLTFSAWGQTTGSGAMFEGRPAMAGAQGGIGAQAGPPQGGIGVQGSGAAALDLRRPAIVDTPERAQSTPERAQGGPAQPPSGAAVDRPSHSGVQAPRDPGIAREHSTTRQAERAAKRTIERSRRGKTPLDNPLPGG